jgi:hypothetical protein
MWYPSWYKKSSSTKGMMEQPAQGKGKSWKMLPNILLVAPIMFVTAPASQ